MKKLFIIAAAVAVAFLASNVVASAQYLPKTLAQHRAGLEDETGHHLTDQEVFSLIDEDVYNATYSGAVKQYKTGKALIITGAVTMGVGTLATVAGAVAVAYGIKTQHIVVDEKKPGQYDLTKADDKGKLAILGYTAGVSVLAVGATCLSVGIPLKIIGTKRLDWVATEYNHDVAANIRVGLTQNGAGLAINF